MVLGWRRAFCTSIPKDRDRDKDPKTSNTSNPTSKFGFFSNPSTPRLHSQPVSSPTLRCRTSSEPSSPKLPTRASDGSAPSSPRSPSSFSLLKSTLGLSAKSRRCGICVQSVRSGGGTAIFTAECSHLFHFPCIAAHVRSRQHLLCPLCNAPWNDLPLLSVADQPKPINLRHVKTKSLRVYDDDEPLSSPTSAARFNPIPESNENDDDDEFQGFIVNPTFSPESNPAVEINLGPEAAVLAIGRGHETYSVSMTVRGSPANGVSRRSPVDLVAVMEVTGEKLQSLKRAMRVVIATLSDADRLSVVAFSAASKRLLPLRRMTPSGRRSARQVVDALGGAAHGSMSVADALKKAAKVLEDRRHKNPSSAVIYLSGERVYPTRFPNVGFPVHVLNIDGGACALESEIGRCLNGLSRVAVHDLTVQIGSGSGQGRISAVYNVTGKPAVHGSGLVRLGDVFVEEEREVLVELRVPTSSVGSHQFLTVRSSYTDPSSGAIVHTKDQALAVPRPQAVRSASPSIQRLRNLHVTVRAVAESRRLVEHNDLSVADHLLTSARALLMKPSCSGSAPEEMLRGLEAEQADLHRLRLQRQRAEEKSEPLTPTSAWRAAERLAKVAIMRKSMNRVSDLHGFENARF